MKNKRLLICLIVFIVIGGLAVLGGTVFRVRDINKDVEIHFKNVNEYIVNTPEYKDNDITKKKLKDSVSFLKNKNALFDLDRKKIKEAIEKADPRVRWTNTEAKFPNKVVITVRERYPVFYYTIGSSTHVVMDATLQIVRIGLPPDRTGPNPPRDTLLDITDQFNASFPSGSANQYLGEKLSKYLLDDEDIKKFNIIVDMMEYFAGGEESEANYEDTIRTFAEIKFYDLRLSHELDLIIKFDDYDITSLEIWDVETDFAEKLSFVWGAIAACKQQPGKYVVRYDEIAGKIQVSWLGGG